MHTLIVSDLHLSKEHPQIVELFCDFLRTQAPQAESLYILGDLFEYWIGDDYVEPPLQVVIDELRQLTQSGCPVHVMHGNRDFLLGEQFERMTGCQIIQDPTLVTLYNKPTLLMHGDSMCIDDVDYIKMRANFRNPDTQRFLLSKSVEERLQIAHTLRQNSQDATRSKTDEITDVNQQCVKETMEQWKVQQLIHGHTHRPGFHELRINNQSACRIVLGDWYHQGSVLRCSEHGCELEQLKP